MVGRQALETLRYGCLLKALQADDIALELATRSGKRLDEALRGVDSRWLSGCEASEQLLEAEMRSSRVPAVKTLDEFDFTSQPGLRREQIDSLHELDLVRRKENVVFLSLPEVGKTHLAISLAIRPLERGRRVYYGSVRDLVESLSPATPKAAAAACGGVVSRAPFGSVWTAVRRH